MPTYSATKTESVRPLPNMPKDQWKLYQQCREIKSRYANGVPLNKNDRKIVLNALRLHPKGKEKFGIGVSAVIVDTYVNNSRCFFIIRPDGTAEDFSLYKCFGRPVTPHRGKIAAAMERFNYMSIVQRYRIFLSVHRNQG
jgi:Protein of unknown function (DUF3223)